MERHHFEQYLCTTNAVTTDQSSLYALATGSLGQCVYCLKVP